MCYYEQSILVFIYLNIVLEYSQNDRFVLLISAVLYLLLSDINGLFFFKEKETFWLFSLFPLLKLSKKVRTTDLVKIILYICFYTRNFVVVYS